LKTRRLSLLAFAFAFAAAGIAMALAVACEGTQSYVYSAQKYDPAGDCLASYTSVETVNGPGAGTMCPAACLSVGADLYVSTMCPPLPAIATAVPNDMGACPAALAAAARGGTCDEPADSGTEDAAEEASDDATAADADPDALETDASDGATPIMDAGDAG
jgi:hypothetical protein